MKKRSIIFYGVGWYLMIPPMLDPSKFIPNIHAPLNKWSQIDSYSRVEQCKFDKKLKSLLADKNAQRDLAEMDTKNKIQFKLAQSLWNFDHTMDVRIGGGLCIASDDLRLIKK